MLRLSTGPSTRRLFGPVLLVMLATCSRDTLTGPSYAIVDGAHQDGNRNFFFLPPLVPDPSHDPDFDPAGFDASLTPTVAICLLQGTDCAAQQPSGFPVVFTPTSDPGSETIRVDAVAQQYIVRWHTSDFALDPAQYYRIQVHVAGALLGYADVDVANSNGDLRIVSTGEYIPLLAGRTLPIKFRIERGAIAFLNIAERVSVSDGSRVLPPALVRTREAISVGDLVRLTPPSVIAVTERIAVTDADRVLPPVSIAVAEGVSIVDHGRVLNPVMITITESIAVTDVVAVTAP